MNIRSDTVRFNNNAERAEKLYEDSIAAGYIGHNRGKANQEKKEEERTEEKKEQIKQIVDMTAQAAQERRPDPNEQIMRDTGKASRERRRMKDGEKKDEKKEEKKAA